MNELPILFSGAMVQAILAGTKTQTRRKISWPLWLGAEDNPPGGEAFFYGGAWTRRPCPYGAPGDRLWVKETYCRLDSGRFAYRADSWTECPADDGKWKPSIFCTRLASRITLEITAVRSERLQAISEDDARAEGGPAVLGFYDDEGTLHGWKDYRSWYRDLWTQINGPGSWESNPYVWVIEFRRVQP